MKKVKTWLLILGLAGPSVVNMSCLSSATRKLWNAALAGAAGFVQTATQDLLTQSLGDL